MGEGLEGDGGVLTMAHMPTPISPHSLPSPSSPLPLRYELMKAYMPTVGTMGLDMMFRTCTVQVWKGWDEGEGGSQRGGT